MNAAKSAMPSAMRSTPMCIASAISARLPVHQPPSSSTTKKVAVRQNAVVIARSDDERARSAGLHGASSQAGPPTWLCPNPAPPRYLVDQHAGRARGVQALDGRRRLGDADHLVAEPPRQLTHALALRADHQHHREI